MLEVLELLKNKQILYTQNVIQIRQGIKQMYPNASPSDCAKLFSSTIHKILERNLSEFDSCTKQTLKDALVHKAIQKGKFDVSAYDVLENYMLLDLWDDKACDALLNWINHQQQTQLSEETLKIVMAQFTQDDLQVQEDASDCPSLPSLVPVKKKLGHLVSCVAVTSLGAVLVVTLGFQSKLRPIEPSQTQAHRATYKEANNPIIPTTTVAPKNHLQANLQYKEIDQKALHDWLLSRDSMLAEEPYFSSILNVAKEFHINPLLMFAITGQEQGFVKKTHPRAPEIANNPFNVYGSWQDFNTDITDTSRIAARTILSLSKGCPENEDPIKWLNQKYAEDPNWHLGVSEILASLEKVAGHN